LSSDLRLISADSHVVEPGDLFERRVPDALRSRAPRRTGAGDAWVLDGAAPVMVGEGTPDTDPARRLEVQDQHGLAAEVLYPTSGLWDAIASVDHPALRLACARAHNDWIAEYCAAASERLIGLGRIPNTGIDDAVAELRHCVGLGLRGVVLDDWPAGLAPSAADDAFWATAADAGTPVSFHYGVGGSPTAPARVVGPGRVPPIAQTFVPFALTGAFDRHPDLRCVLAHADAGWLAAALEGMDSRYLRTMATRTTGLLNEEWLPSDYVRRVFWFTFHHDAAAIAGRQLIGAAHLMWASHSGSDGDDLASERSAARRITSGLPDEERARLLAGNCARLYRLPGSGDFSSAELADFRPLVIV
jgi:predicted TIM-barrel fold metal-dependent hydrolase